jgi:hypothetical protein
VKRLLDEPSPVRQLISRGPPFARHHHDLDGRPAISHRCGKLETVHGTRHVDVGQHNINQTADQHVDRAVRVAYRNHLVPGLAELELDIHENERLVFHEEYFQTHLLAGQRAQSFPSEEGPDMFPRKHKRRQVSEIITTDELAEHR